MSSVFSTFHFRILVGAPKATDPELPGVKEPGSVFACQAPIHNNTSCVRLQIDSKI